jgi:hypothetical protein
VILRGLLGGEGLAWVWLRLKDGLNYRGVRCEEKDWSGGEAREDGLGERDARIKGRDVGFEEGDGLSQSTFGVSSFFSFGVGHRRRGDDWRVVVPVRVPRQKISRCVGELEKASILRAVEYVFHVGLWCLG